MKTNYCRTPLCVLTIAFLLSSCSGNSFAGVSSTQTATPTNFDPSMILQPVPSIQPTPIQITDVPTERPTPLPPVPTSTFKISSETSLQDECIRITSGMKELQAQEDFEPQQYFQILTHLKTQPGYVLDYFIFGDDMGSLPLIYSRKSTDSRLENYDEYLALFGEQQTTERSYSGLNHDVDYLKVIQTDGSEEGYFEYVALAMLGGQFKLYWHAGYNDYKIMCQPNDIKEIRADIQSFFGDDLPNDVLSRAKKINFTPIIKKDGDKVVLRYVSFTKWGGFFEEIYTIDSNSPYHIIDYSYVPLIDYDCGIAF